MSKVINRNHRDLEILPEGEVMSFTLEPGLHSCGQAMYGIGIRYGDSRASGVLTNDDLVRIQDLISDHFQTLSEMSKLTTEDKQ